MIVLVSDSSVLIDLERGQLLEAAFTGPFPMAVPDYLYLRELKDNNGPFLRQLGLGVVALNPAETQFAQAVSQQHVGLSLPDCFALSYARRPDHELLTGDQQLRGIAEGHGIACHGLLWLLDRMLEGRPDRRGLLFAGLLEISTGKRCRLPRAEVERRLLAWGD